MGRQKTRFDLLIAGGGLAGLTLAAALAGSGLRLALVDAGDPRHPTPDGRTTALAYGARIFYERIGLWRKLAAKACPIEDIRVLNGRRSGLLDFASGDLGREPFGHIVENDHLKSELAKGALRSRSLTLFSGVRLADCAADADGASLSLADGRELAADLLIAADGRGSFCRTRLGIPVHRHDYGQAATICTIAHSEPHNNLALENFFPGGPFAVLPMLSIKTGGKTIHRSAIVWSEKTATAATLNALPAQEFTAHLEERVGGWLGRIGLLSKPACYPLGLVHAVRYSKGRALLLGDAAHAIHPIAGQGFNLTIRDIGVLAELLLAGADAGALAANYEKLRRADNVAMITATHGLDRLFSNTLAPLARLRGIGLDLVNHLSGPRRFFMRQAMGAGGRRRG